MYRVDSPFLGSVLEWSRVTGTVQYIPGYRLDRIAYGAFVAG